MSVLAYLLLYIFIWMLGLALMLPLAFQILFLGWSKIIIPILDRILDAIRDGKIPGQVPYWLLFLVGVGLLVFAFTTYTPPLW